MGIVCDSKKLIFLIKPTPTPSKDGNLILQTSKFIIYKTRRVNSRYAHDGEFKFREGVRTKRATRISLST
ncbi:MAG: hypothetical protein ACJA2S_001068 [Cyclobacteriaceae bacterium]|jgi:hypothetical protein